MANWSSLGVPRGGYDSQSFYVSNNLDRYIATITDDISNPYNETLNYYFRVSYDQINWTEWKLISTSSSGFLDEFTLTGLYLQIRVSMIATNDSTKPYFRSLNFALSPFSYIDNTGDLPIKPKIWIRKKNGAGDIALINATTKQELKLKGLSNNEEVYIDCENEEIVSSNQSLGVYRYDSHNDEYLELVTSDNYLSSIGDFDLDIRYKEILLQE